MILDTPTPDLEQQGKLKQTLPQTLVAEDFKIQNISTEDNLAIFFGNLAFLCKNTEQGLLSAEDLKTLGNELSGQLNELWLESKLQKFGDWNRTEDLQPYQKKLIDLQQILRQMNQLKNSASSEQKYINYQSEVNKYMKDIEQMLYSGNLKTQLETYEVMHNEKDSIQKEGTSQIDIPATHFFKEQINTKIDYSTAVFSYIRPENHQLYITQAASVYNDITPYKIKNIALSLVDGPVINKNNYFDDGIQQNKALIGYCLPNTHKFVYYYLADIVKNNIVGKQFYNERDLSNQWTFSTQTRSIITPNGKIFAINCRTNKQKIDPYLYEITETKASNRGPLPSPKLDSSMVHINGYIYLIGGRGQGQPCSRKNYRYSIRDKKWSNISESNVGLRKTTVCSVNNRYILKIGGLNEFDYINKIIEMYDTVTDRWSLVRASPRNILEEIQILQDSLAVQINDDQIYVFGGKNSNKFSTDSSFVLVISEIHERKKGAAKVSGEFWNVSMGKRNILTFFGEYYATNAVIMHNCIYGLRTSVTSSLSR